VLPSGILATQAKRLEVETAGRTSAVAAKANVIDRDIAGVATGGGFSGVGTLSPTRFEAGVATREAPISAEIRTEALAAVDKDLVAAGVLDNNGNVAEAIRAELEFERTTCLPTQAIVVKGCIDHCNVCEDSLKKAIDLDLIRKNLQNKLLEKQIELLEKSQEYRCCPGSEAEDETETE
jgi:hypothetical protein